MVRVRFAGSRLRSDRLVLVLAEAAGGFPTSQAAKLLGRSDWVYQFMLGTNASSTTRSRMDPRGLEVGRQALRSGPRTPQHGEEVERLSELRRGAERVAAHPPRDEPTNDRRGRRPVRPRQHRREREPGRTAPIADMTRITRAPPPPRAGARTHAGAGVPSPRAGCQHQHEDRPRDSAPAATKSQGNRRPDVAATTGSSGGVSAPQRPPTPARGVRHRRGGSVRQGRAEAVRRVRDRRGATRQSGSRTPRQQARLRERRHDRRCADGDGAITSPTAPPTTGTAATPPRWYSGSRRAARQAAR